MARSKAPASTEKKVVKVVTKTETTLTTRPEHGSLYQLDPAQVERATTALISHMKKHAQEKEEKSEKKNLAADEDEPEQSDAIIYLTVSTKQHVKDDKRLKPSKIVLPHSIQNPEARICIIVKDPQREYKNIVADPSFPEDLRAKVVRVIGLDKLKKKYKTFETKRQLFAEYDIFLADDRVNNLLPNLLGKVFYNGKGKRPIPITIAPQTGGNKDGKRTRVVSKPKEVAQEVEAALNATYIHLTPTATTSIKIGKLSQTTQQIKENIEAVVSALTTKFIPHGWRNIRNLYIKGPTTIAVPIWLADELWRDEAQVLEEPWKPMIKEGGKKSEKKRKWEEWEEEMLDEDELAEMKASKKARKARVGKVTVDKEANMISREGRRSLKREALKTVQTPLITG